MECLKQGAAVANPSSAARARIEHYLLAMQVTEPERSGLIAEALALAESDDTGSLQTPIAALHEVLARCYLHTARPHEPAAVPPDSAAWRIQHWSTRTSAEQPVPELNHRRLPALSTLNRLSMAPQHLERRALRLLRRVLGGTWHELSAALRRIFSVRTS